MLYVPEFFVIQVYFSIYFMAGVKDLYKVIYYYETIWGESKEKKMFVGFFVCFVCFKTDSALCLPAKWNTPWQGWRRRDVSWYGWVTALLAFLFWRKLYFLIVCHSIFPKFIFAVTVEGQYRKFRSFCFLNFFNVNLRIISKDLIHQSDDFHLNDFSFINILQKLLV